jgi:molecular chaperone GrpE
MSEPRKVRIVAKDDEFDGSQDHASADASPGEGSPEGDLHKHSPSVPVDDELKVLEAKLEAKEREFNETHDRLMRVTAEFENYKKRASREIEDFRKYANQSLLKEMLSVLDHIELAIQAASSKSGCEKNLLEGLNLTQKEFLRILDKFNVKTIEAVGQPFNPEFHEAILREPSDELPENTVLREMQKGYLINGRLLRPSLVVVAAPRAQNGLPDPERDIGTI